MKLDRVNIVGIVQSAKGLMLAAKSAGIGAFEIRLDAFARMPDPSRVAGLPGAVIATVRDAREGGLSALPASRRIDRYLEWIPFVGGIDVELAFHREMRTVIDAARDAGVKVIFSLHDFASVPRNLRAMQSRAAKLGADAFKVAATPRGAGELAALVALLDRPPLPTAMMGMGKLGRVSRVAAMACGSVLNYGWLERPNVSGQWSAKELGAFLP